MTGRDVPADDRLREAIVGALHGDRPRPNTGGTLYPEDPCYVLADALLPVVRAYGDLRAAEELRRAAADWERDDSPAGFVEDWLRERAAALTAREEAGR